MRAIAMCALVALGCGDAAGSDATVPVPDAGPDAALPWPCEASDTPNLRLRLVTDQLTDPVFAISPPGDSRLFVVEQGGAIRIVKEGILQAQPFLTVTGLQTAGSEQGLLGLAFHPDFAVNGRLFLNYTAFPNGDTVIAEYGVSELDLDQADPVEERILEIAQPASNHNGGMLEFGPHDGMLYIGLGDGGGGGDPHSNGQDIDSLLGKMLRIDVDGAAPYEIPADNPYFGVDGADAIWALGLRNPWRFSFDTTGDLYIGDVGQCLWEEIHVTAPGEGGANYGWPVIEGQGHCFNAANFCVASVGCDADGLINATLEYDHGDGRCAVTGGFVYRGACLNAWTGYYFFGDYCSGQIWAYDPEAEATVDLTSMLESGERISGLSSFGRDGEGELYVVSLDGSLFRIEPVQ